MAGGTYIGERESLSALHGTAVVSQEREGPVPRARLVSLRGQGGVMVVVLLTVMIAMLVPTRSTADLYRWVDESGRLHYSNVPAEIRPGKEATRVSDEEAGKPARPDSRMPTEAGAGVEEKAGAGVRPESSAAGEIPKASTGAELSLARSELRQQLAEAESLAAEVDRKLDALAKTRLKWANKANPAVGGAMAVGAAEARSEEEEALEKRREELTKQIEEVRTRLAELPRDR